MFRAKIFNPLSENEFAFVEDGGLAVDSTGTVLDMGNYHHVKSTHPNAELVDFSEHWIIPGFVDAHVHVAQVRAMASYGSDLLEWLKQHIYPAERDFTPEAADAICPDFYSGLLSYGVTAAAIYSNVRADSTEVCFEWAQKTGIRAIIGKVMMDRDSPDFLIEKTADSLEASEQVCKRWHGVDNGRLLYAFTPRFAPTCSRELMEGVHDLAHRYGAYVQTHISETQGEVDRVRELFPEARSYADVYARAGLLGSKTILAHAIHLQREECSLLRNSDTALVHCPTSNLFLRSGLMHLRKLMDMGFRIGLGSDVGASPTLSPFEAMRAAIYVHGVRRSLGKVSGRDVSPATAFFLATLGGAQALGLEAKIGSLTPGKDADFAVLNPRRLGLVQEAAQVDGTPDQLLARLVFLGDDTGVEQTYVRGRLCYAQEEHEATG